jgi:hypothetical protein
VWVVPNFFARKFRSAKASWRRRPAPVAVSVKLEKDTALYKNYPKMSRVNSDKMLLNPGLFKKKPGIPCSIPKSESSPAKTKGLGCFG